MSKTVKRVSKTVKRVMRVTILGMVAMLGAKAEAHYYVFKGKVKYCSVCVDAMLTDHPAEHEELPVNLASHTEEVEFCVTTESVDVLCPPGGAELKSPILEDVPLFRKLVVRKPILSADITKDTILPGDITKDITDITKDVGITAEVEGVVSDTSLPLVKICNGSMPLDVLIRKMKVEIKTYAEGEGKPLSTLQTACTLSDKFTLKKYPKNVPLNGTPYDCI